MKKKAITQTNRDLRMKLGTLEARTKDLEEIQELHVKKHVELRDFATEMFKITMDILESVKLARGYVYRP